jgi:uncharacterized protein YjbI with pentapeptide repeats
MGDRGNPQNGRSALELTPDNDYSGLTLADRYLIGGNIEKSFFNGADLTNCSFSGVAINNTEFAEAMARDCHFNECDLSGSDLIHSAFDRVTFLRCKFAKGEWREASFHECHFVECDFDHTTVTLCGFEGCHFDAASLTSAEHRAFYFNVFSQCSLPSLRLDLGFASRNFGVSTPAEPVELVRFGAGVTLEQVCLLNNMGHLKVVTLAAAADALHFDLATGGRRLNSALTFFAKIIRALTTERRISATSLIYMEDSITRLAGAVDDKNIFVAAMAAVIEIRSALFSIAAEESELGAADQQSQKITIYFSETFSRHQAEVLRETLAASSSRTGGGFEISAFRNSSTLIEMVSVGTVTLSAALTSVNFVLRQATVTVERVTDLKRAARKFSGAKARRRTRQELVPQAPRVRSIMRAGAVSPEMAPVREAVRRYGRVVVELDEKATVTILAQNADLR